MGAFFVDHHGSLLWVLWDLVRERCGKSLSPLFVCCPVNITVIYSHALSSFLALDSLCLA